MALTVLLAYALCFGTAASAQTCTNGTLNVKSYGAQGNGTHDDTSAIQSTINAAKSGQCVYFPNGTYNISSALQVGQVSNSSGFTIYGQSQSAAAIEYTCSGTCTGYPMIQIGYANEKYVPTNITIQTLTLDGNGSLIGSSYTTATAGIQTYGGSGHTFQNLTIQNLPGSSSNTSPIGIHLNGPATCTNNTCTTGTTNSLIYANSISNIGTATTSTTSMVAGIRCSWGSSANIIQGNKITNTGRDGIAGDDYSTDLVIKHNTVSGTGDCAASCQSANPPGPALGIELFTGCDRGIVDDNTVDHWISLGASGFCAVRRNTVVNKSTSILGYTGLEFAGDDVWPATDEIFTKNTVGPSSSNSYGQQQVGVSVSNFTTDTKYSENYAYWANNTIQDMDYEGIQLNSGYAGINYHYFYNNQILNTAYNNNNSNYANPGNGFRLFGNSGLDYVVLDTNTIESNGVGAPCNNGVSGGGNAIVYGSVVNYVTAVNNTIANNGGDAVAGNTSPTNSEWPLPNKPNSGAPANANYVSGNGCQNNSASNTGWTGVGTSVSFTYSPLNPAAGQTVTFTPSYGGSNGIQHLMWDFDDGIPVIPASPYTQQQTHKYNYAGTCNVTVIVWDTSGVASRYEQTIVVGNGTGNCNGN
jgi:hypothetical protein